MQAPTRVLIGPFLNFWYSEAKDRTSLSTNRAIWAAVASTGLIPCVKHMSDHVQPVYLMSGIIFKEKNLEYFIPHEQSRTIPKKKVIGFWLAITMYCPV